MKDTQTCCCTVNCSLSSVKLLSSFASALLFDLYLGRSKECMGLLSEKGPNIWREKGPNAFLYSRSQKCPLHIASYALRNGVSLMEL